MIVDFKNNFVLDRKLGEGSFSVVFKVKDKSNGKCYAAKKLLKSYTADDIVDCAELRTLQRLEYHPNVLSIIDYVHDPNDGTLILILDLMDMSLYDFIKDRKKTLSEKRCKNYLYQMALGLQHIHRSGIFHRDIKPENILIRQLKKYNNSLHMELIQLADLGSVCEIHSTSPRTPYISTRWYRAPECLLTSGQYGPKMDVWALGTVFYEILELQPLFPGDNELDQLSKIHNILGTPSKSLLKRFPHLDNEYEFIKKPAIPFYQLLPRLSNFGIDVLRKTLSYHPDMRISSKKLVEHSYFDDLRLKYKTVNTSGKFLMSTSLDEGLNRMGKYSFLSSTASSRNSSFSTSNQHLEGTIRRSKNLGNEWKKQKERGWGMNECPAKSKIIKKIKNQP